jgi:cysteine desulfurase family protein (TIGR01976 family)
MSDDASPKVSNHPEETDKTEDTGEWNMNNEWVTWCRDQYPAFQHHGASETPVYFDGPAGTQVPQCVLDAMRDHLVHRNANRGGVYPVSKQCDTEMAECHQALADFLGASDPDTISFGPNMTTLTFAFSRAMARTWPAGDEILLTSVEHDANFTPWVLAARDAGVTVRVANLRRDDATLDTDDWYNKLNSKTRLVAIGGASNATGARTPLKTLCDAARDAGAISFVDAVHLAPHTKVEVEQIGCDVLVCSAYKFFGPHLGIQYGKRELLEELVPYKLRPAPDSLPGRWMTGTQSHEGIAGARAAVDYLANIGRRVSGTADLPRDAALRGAMSAIESYERELCQQLLAGLAAIPSIKVWGITDPARAEERLPTVSLTSARHSPQTLAEQLAARGIYSWHGNYYAVPLAEALGVEPQGMVRVGMVHYNTPSEVDRLLDALRQLDGA